MEIFARLILRRLCAGLCLIFYVQCNAAFGDDSVSLTEKQIKFGFISNFAVLTVWPSSIGSTLNLCIIGDFRFDLGSATLNGKMIGARRLVPRSARSNAIGDDCQIVFIPSSEKEIAPSLLAQLRYKPTLTIADWPGALDAGVMVNMVSNQNRITFDVNLKPVRVAGLGLSSRLLRLANKVLP